MTKKAPTVAEVFESMEYGPALESTDAANAWLDSHKRKFSLFINGEFVKPRFRVHQHTNEKVHQTVLDHIEMCDNELSRLVYDEPQRQAIEKCKAGWINIRDNFQHVHHWKLKYPDMPLIKP